MLQRFIFEIKAVVLNFLFIKESWKIKRIIIKDIKNIVQHNSALIIIRNVSWAANYYDFWRSYDTEYWRNDAAQRRNKLHSSTFSHRKQLFNNVIIFHNVYNILDQTNAALVSKSDFQIHLTTPGTIRYINKWKGWNMVWLCFIGESAGCHSRLQTLAGVRCLLLEPQRRPRME